MHDDCLEAGISRVFAYIYFFSIIYKNYNVAQLAESWSLAGELSLN